LKLKGAELEVAEVSLGQDHQQQQQVFFAQFRVALARIAKFACPPQICQKAFTISFFFM
jgi:hypothetical protein